MDVAKGRHVEFEGKVMVEGLKQIREVIQATEEKIEEICSLFPEYYGIWSGGFGEGSWGDWGSLPFSGWAAGLEAGGQAFDPGLDFNEH